jgi:hypothetical protein
LLVLTELPGSGVGMGRSGLLVGEGLLELRLVGLRQLLLGDTIVRQRLVGLVLAGREVELAGAGLGTAPPAGIDPARPGCSSAIGVTGLAIALDWSGGASVAVSMSLACPSLPSVTRPLTSPLTSPALPEAL